MQAQVTLTLSVEELDQLREMLHFLERFSRDGIFPLGEGDKRDLSSVAILSTRYLQKISPLYSMSIFAMTSTKV
jgi:hypothetical protein